jgi:hypothetical protein
MMDIIHLMFLFKKNISEAEFGPVIKYKCGTYHLIRLPDEGGTPNFNPNGTMEMTITCVVLITQFLHRLLVISFAQPTTTRPICLRTVLITFSRVLVTIDGVWVGEYIY